MNLSKNAIKCTGPVSGLCLGALLVSVAAGMVGADWAWVGAAGFEGLLGSSVVPSV